MSTFTSIVVLIIAGTIVAGYWFRDGGTLGNSLISKAAAIWRFALNSMLGSNPS